jgi:hypothetical protein
MNYYVLASVIFNRFTVVAGSNEEKKCRKKRNLESFFYLGS